MTSKGRDHYARYMVHLSDGLLTVVYLDSSKQSLFPRYQFFLVVQMANGNNKRNAVARATNEIKKVESRCFALNAFPFLCGKINEAKTKKGRKQREPVSSTHTQK